MNSLLGCFQNPWGKSTAEKTNCRAFPPSASTENSTLVVPEQAGAELDSDIRAHLLLHLVGGESYGAVCPSTCKMETEVWIMLPDELLRRVLLFLPFISKLRFRAVSKEWRQLLTSLEYSKDSVVLRLPRAPLVCAYRFIHGNRLRDRGIHSTTTSPVALESCQSSRNLNCRELPLLFPAIHAPDSRSQGCRFDADVSAEDGLLTIEVWKEQQLAHGTLRRHRGVPTVLQLFTFLVNPITDTVLSLPSLRTDGDQSLGRNLGLVSSKVEYKAGRFDTYSCYWTSWWLDVGIGLRQNTSWFTRVRKHPIEVGTYPEWVNVTDRSGEQNMIGVGITELEAGKFQAVISGGVLYGVHYLADGSNRLLTRNLHRSQTIQWSQWHDDVSVPKMNGASDVHFFLVAHSVSLDVFYVGQSCQNSGKVIFHICRLQPDCYTSWFWLPVSTMPSALVDEMMTQLGTARSWPERSVMLDRAFASGDCIVLVFRNSGPQPRLCFVAFDVYEETWQIIFNDADCEALAEFDGFFEVRPNLRFPHEIREGLGM